MIKSWGGDGYVRNVQFQDFLSRGTAYGLGGSRISLPTPTNHNIDINQYWSSQTEAPGAGVQLSNITFSVRVSGMVRRFS